MPNWGGVYSDLAGSLLVSASANNASGAGSTALDLRASQPWGILETKCTGNSAILDFQYSPNNVDWATALSITATNGGTAFAQISAFYPYVRAQARLVYSAAGGSAVAHAYYRAGIGV